MSLDGYSPERGQTRNRLNDRHLDQRADDLRRSKDPICRLVFVYDYDPVNQTVDVVPADDRGSQPIRGIPIGGSGGHGVRFIRAWQGTKQTNKPDIGVILYPRVGGGRRILDFIRRDTNALYERIERTAVFLGGFPAAIAAGETPVANVVATTPLLHQIGKGDNGIVKSSGAGFMVKESDDVVIRGKRVILLGMDQTEADLDPVAVNGGDVPPVSDTVFAGRT